MEELMCSFQECQRGWKAESEEGGDLSVFVFSLKNTE